MGLAGCGGSTARDAVTPPPDPIPALTPAGPNRPLPAPTDTAALEIPQPGLALGITEPNPALVWSEQARPDVPAPFADWRTRLGRTRPAVYRLMVSWRTLEPRRGALELAAPQTGCLRDRQPCAGWAGVREQLAALASRQETGGWEAMIVISDTPDWAAVPRSACEPEDGEPRSRAPTDAALPAYRALIRALAAEADRQGAHVRYWSAWNEPNHPYFLASQHVPCDESASTASVDDYARLVRALDAELAQLPGRERVLGELAGLLETRPHTTSVGRFIRALPRELVCDARVWSQHDYRGGRATVDAAWAALASHDCSRRHRVWITETGAGSPSVSLSAGAARAAGRPTCRQLDRMLSGWWRDERVDVAIQYTLREDDLFRVGLVSTDLARALPTWTAWTTWSERADATDPPPTAPC